MNGRMSFAHQLGEAFKINGQSVDWSPVRSTMHGMLASIASVIGRRLSADEIASIPASVRRQFCRRCAAWPLSRRADDGVYQLDGLVGVEPPIRLRVVLARGRSTCVPNAVAKLTLIELCDCNGQQIGTLHDLPFEIVNAREVTFALRALLGHRFDGKTAWQKVFKHWAQMGSPSELPLDLPLEIEGCCWTLRLVGGPSCATAQLYDDRGEISLRENLPEIYKMICIRALNFESLAEMTDANWMVEDLEHVIRCRFQAATLNSIGSVGYGNYDGQNVLVFPTGEKLAGDRILGVAHSYAEDDERFTRVTWQTETLLVESGYDGDFPIEPDWHRHMRFDPTFDLLSLEPHALTDSTRFGFPKDIPREELQAAVEAALRRGLEMAAKEGCAFGFYDGCCDSGTWRKLVCPVSAFVPFVNGDGQVTAAVVIRQIDKGDQSFYQPITILELPWVYRLIDVLGDQAIRPGWLFRGKGSHIVVGASFGGDSPNAR